MCIACQITTRMNAVEGDLRPVSSEWVWSELALLRERYALVDHPYMVAMRRGELGRWQGSDLDGALVLVASNHPNLRETVEAAELPYPHVPVTKDTKSAAEAQLLEELDAGPIIEQDVIRVTHADDVDGLVRQGAEVERAVLARAVQWHCQDRVLRHGNSTVVF